MGARHEWTWAAVTLSMLAFGGCDNGGGTTDVDSSVGNTDGGGVETDGGGVVPGDGGGGGGATCAQQATSYCTQFETCSPALFIGSWESSAICIEEYTRSCGATGTIPMTNGVVDPAACLAARMGSCNAFLDPVTPDACAPLAGDVAQNGDCGIDSQCAMGTNSDGVAVRLYCYGATSLMCMDGVCAAPDRPMSGRNTCRNATTFRDNCDTLAGYQCVADFDADTGVVPEGTRCLEVQYGASGAGCYPGSDRQCASGFACQTATKRCMAVLGVGATCDTAASLCDTRLGLTCADDGDGNDVCTAPAYVRVGAQCGLVDGVTQLCSAYALCNTDTPSVCVVRRARGETCTATPNNCRLGLACEGGTCMDPDPATCP